MAEKAIPHQEENAKYANVKFPPGFAHPYVMTAKDGREWDKAIVNIPEGTNANGIDLSGYSIDVFMNSYQKGQIASGEGITCGFRTDQKVELFKGNGDERESMEIDPWARAKAVKEQRENFAAEKAAEREAAKVQEAGKDDKDYSLGTETKDTVAAKEELGGSAPEMASPDKAL